MGGCQKALRGCDSRCGHWQIVNSYRQEYQREYDQLVEESGGYATEIADNMRCRREAGKPLPQFKDWLIGLKREPMDDPALTINQLDHQALAAGEPLESPAYLEAWSNRAGQEFLSDRHYVHPSVANEALLLAVALASERGVEALRVIGAEEFRSVFHQNVRRAILDRADQGLDHGALAVTQLLRNRRLSTFEELPEPINEGPYGPDNPWVPQKTHNTQLPIEFDPTQQGNRKVDARLFGLGAWETYSPPADRAPIFAQTIRSDYRARKMETVCTDGAEAARGAIEYDATGLVERDLVGQVRTTVSKAMIDFPPMLDENLQPTTGHSPGAAVLPGQRLLNGTELPPENLTQVPPVDVIDQDLRLPPAPKLSAAGREALGPS